MKKIYQQLCNWKKHFTSTGAKGERAAAKFLKANGYTILAHNVHTNIGEIDIIAKAPDQKTFVIAEVKSAGSSNNTPPEIHVNTAKKRKLISLAAQLAKRHSLANAPWRFDVISVRFQPAPHKTIIRHYPGAFMTQ